MSRNGHRLPLLRQRTWIVLRLRELRGYLHDTLSRPRVDARHVLIYAQGRSGTTLLESLLVSTGHFNGLGEPLHKHTRSVWAPMHYIRGLGRGAGSRNLIVHVKGSQLVRERRKPIDPGALMYALHENGWTIVHVHRRGVADQVLSECFALARGAYHKTDDGKEELRIRIPVDEFLKRFEQRLQFAEDDRKALERLPHLTLTCEDDLVDLENHQATADQICDKLTLPRCSVRTDLRRMGGTDPRDRLENHDEIAAALATRGMAWADSPVSLT